MNLSSIKQVCITSITLLLYCSHGSDPAPIVKPDPPPPAETAAPFTEVMMQAFYWDVTPGGVWWDAISSKLDI